MEKVDKDYALVLIRGIREYPTASGKLCDALVEVIGKVPGPAPPEPPAQHDTTLYEVHHEGSVVPAWFTSLAKVKLEIRECKDRVCPVSWVRKIQWDHADTITCHKSFQASSNFAGL
jgi:hypothetical protein